MKVKKTLAVLIIFIIIAVGIIPASAIEETQNESGGAKLKLSLIEDQKLRKEAIANVDISVSDEEEQALDDNKALMKAVVTKDKKEKKEYADYFAGSYIDDDESLVVQFTRDAKKSEINECMENVSDSAEIEIVKYSYEDIKAQYEKDSDLMAELSDAVKNGTATDLQKSVSNNLVSIALSQEENCNIITLKEVTEKSKNDFITCFGDKNVIFKESKSEEISKCKTLVKPGSSFAIYKSGAYYYGRSVGPRLYYEKADGSTIYGFLTAAHCVDEMGQIVYYKKDGEYVKYGHVSSYKNSGCADAAFIKQTNTTDFSTSKYTAYSNSTGSKTEKYKACQNCTYAYLGLDVVEGATIYKCGKTTYLTKGKITNTEYSATIDGTSHKDLVLTTCNCDFGDSGGVVFTIHNSNTYTYDVAGVTTAKTGNGELIFTSLERYDEFMMEKHNCNGFYQY
ncbi:MAG: hypothetical protein ACI4HO_07410 [Ruminococcus sp.]